MSNFSKGIFIVGAKRTAFGTFGGVFKNVSQTKLQTVACRGALKAAGLNPTEVESVIIGNVMSLTSSDGIYLPRHTALQCGVPIETPALGINRLCGSGFQSIINGAQDIVLGAAKVALTGGVENMSQAPYVARNFRFGTALGTDYTLEDSLWLGLTDSYCGLPMALTAEKLAEKYHITRQEVDEFALKSQKNWKKGHEEGVFTSELEPFTLRIKEKDIHFTVDEHPRPQTTIETLSKLPSLFKKNGTVTAGTASGISDGAASVVLASEEAIKKHDLKPLARVVAYSTVGVPPEIMGFGPVPAVKNLLKCSGIKMENIDLIEINEAFGVQVLACAKQLNCDMDKLNVNGGAIALGHPLAASGSRITAHLVHELRRKHLKRAVGAACIGGGQGIAILLERV